jgi:hypothetical protein
MGSSQRLVKGKKESVEPYTKWPEGKKSSPISEADTPGQALTSHKSGSREQHTN